ncbi:hypothetical protein OAP57_00350 [bacterium]|nr:hypothetical protein [bacterium]
MFRNFKGPCKIICSLLLFSLLIADQGKSSKVEIKDLITHDDTYYWLGMEENGEWVMFDNIGVTGRSLVKVTQVVNKMSLEPFMKIEGQYKNQKNKVEGRVKMVSNSEKLIKSVLD